MSRVVPLNDCLARAVNKVDSRRLEMGSRMLQYILGLVYQDGTFLTI